MEPTIAAPAERLVAHRGYAARYPENTLLAVKEALKAGAHYVEVDIQLTADRVAVVFHDSDLGRLCGRSESIHSFHSDRLDSLSCSYPSRFGERYRNEPLATLAALAELIADWPQVQFFIELKPESIGHFGVEAMLAAVAAPLEGCREQVVLISYDRAVLHLASQSGWRIGAVEHHWPDPADDEWRQLDPEYLFLDFRELPNGALELGNTRLALFEIAEPGLARTLMARGADLIETFEIGTMLTALR
ncbi:hypothetical protein GCM10011348_23580 [Marinobacterium nitratireducens]|uniref:GP-PDE domain-containing protein n=1 Tax=Marinobacterium nitratireducens TaxID=518897 RepID=A0A918DTZ9_9GAMM|nr:glycerophosphodiester phosphodiesterase family protein [Marinobacterium nitratireducens]GGO82363.1 hypothetical protein GCM10011348_23580 [Marinobacterium nitratireducens]